jgi:hypothetical protein
MAIIQVFTESANMTRTNDAEGVAAYISEKSLLAESVYLGPKFNDQRIEKEVTDLLLVHRDQALVVQMKCQNNPDNRLGNKLSRWVDRSAKSGYNQLRGTLRTLSERDYWCIHPTLGRVDFTKNQLAPIHGIVVVEHRVRGLSLSKTLPVDFRDVPISYFTLSDFLIHISELRTFPDFCEFLHARHGLDNFDLHITGREEELLGHYMLNNGNFPVGLSQEQRLSHLREERLQFDRFLLEKLLGDAECEEVELAARALRKRAAGYPPRHRDDKNYRVMQLALMDLSYAERRLVGKKIKQAIAELSAKEPLAAQMCAHAVISNADLTVVISATRGVNPKEAFCGCLHFIKEVYGYTEPTKNILVINLNLPNSSPKYWFYFITPGGAHAEQLVKLTRESIIPEWITFTPEAKF